MTKATVSLFLALLASAGLAQEPEVIVRSSSPRGFQYLPDSASPVAETTNGGVRTAQPRARQDREWPATPEPASGKAPKVTDDPARQQDPAVY